VSLSIKDRVVVFDYGEVISLSPSEADRAVLVATSGVEPELFWETYWKHRDDLDQGRVDVPGYWARVAADTASTWSASTVYALWVADFRGWISVEPGTIDLIAAMHVGGTRLALLSNAGFDFASPFRFSPMGKYFERVFISAEMDSVKPDHAIYREVADGLGIELAQMVFIDNKKVNTDAAAELGATVHHYEGVDGLRVFLESLAS
jgi:putative hydrolase of the HAD superfamily